MSMGYIIRGYGGNSGGPCRSRMDWCVVSSSAPFNALTIRADPTGGIHRAVLLWPTRVHPPGETETVPLPRHRLEHPHRPLRDRVRPLPLPPHCTNPTRRLAVTAYLWAADPWVSTESFSSRTIGVPSQIVAILWMGLSASLDALLTLTLLRALWRARSPTFDTTNDVIRRLIALTLETVLLTHLCGAAMCVLFLSQPAAHRTKTTAFWILLEVITELYALSVVFTINARSGARRTLKGSQNTTPTPAPTPTPGPLAAATDTLPAPTRDFRDQRQLDFAVEGFQDVPRFSYHFPPPTTSAAVGAGAVEMSPLGEDVEKGDTPDLEVVQPGRKRGMWRR